MFIYKKKYFVTLAVLLILFTGLAAFRLPDTALIQTIISRLTKYNEYYQPDKIYLLTDRPYYTPGEIIWLKAYQVDASEHIPHSRSRVVYVELLNNSQKLITNQKLRVENNTAAGDIQLPADLPAGTYTLRAYTKWMLNAGTDLTFTKAIQVYQSNIPGPAENTSKELPLADLQFFPEGGSLVNGIESTVAFKGINRLGKGVDIKGAVTDLAGDTITTFQSLHLGMGSFRLQPQAGHMYKATVVTSNVDTLHYPLPASLADGWVMTTDNTSPDAIKIQVQMAGNTSAQATIIAQVRGKVIFSTTSAPGAVVSIPKSTIPEGVVHITAFDGLGNARCERLAFINHSNHLQIQVVPEKKAYGPREKVNLAITVQDKSGNPVAANLAMSITDASQIANPEHRQDILSYLLLTSDLKGYVEEPGFYFSTDAKADKALDHLMLTQGWRRFTWKEVLQNPLPELRYEMENGLSLAGQLINPATKAPVHNQLVTLSIPGGNPAFYQMYTDQEGYFQFSDFSYYQDKDIFLRAINQTGMQITIDTILNIPFPQVPTQDFVVGQVNNYVTKSNLLKKIEAAFVAAGDTQEWQVTKDGAKELRTTIADVPADHLINLSDYNQFPGMAETIKEVVPGLIIKDKKGVYSLRVLDIKRKMYFKDEPVYFIDGLLFTSNEVFLKLDPASVQSIEVFGRPDKLARFGNFGNNGVIAAYTHTGDFYPTDLPGLLKLPLKGYYQTREYYKPVYSHTNAGGQKPDLRPLIYWNPSVTTDAAGKTQVSFYNTDNIGTYEISIEGISATGIPGVTSTRYEVQLPMQSKK